MYMYSENFLSRLLVFYLIDVNVSLCVNRIRESSQLSHLVQLRGAEVSRRFLEKNSIPFIIQSLKIFLPNIGFNLNVNIIFR